MSGQTQPETALQALAEKLRTDAIAIFGEGKSERDIIEWFYGSLLAAAPAQGQQVGQELDELRRSCAEILGQDPETWPSHGNAPLAIASALALAVSTAPLPAPAQDVAELANAARALLEADAGCADAHDMRVARSNLRHALAAHDKQKGEA